ncbi:MAG: exodeoxyribonuclease V subunit alpha [Thermodesulfobacteriota bacterium]|jgi:exodeoxyribonuclease V alpha subunit
MKQELFDSLLKKNILSELDIQFAGFITRLSGKENPELFFAAALASHYQGEGNICFDLSAVAGKKLLEDDPDSPICPELNKWIGILKKEDIVGRPGDYKPLILDGPRLYLYRYWDYEKKLIDILRERANNGSPVVDEGLLKDGLNRLFPNKSLGETDWQKVAGFTSALKKFCIISGGPGTGKTFTVAKILALLLEQRKGENLRIALAAPTGKAAARLQDAIRNAREGLNCPDNIKTAIPAEASTIHRLLKSIPDSPYFRFDAQNPLPADVVVIDEASMIDLALLSKLAQAVPSGSKLILLGDKDQLASVEAGAVLGDICDTGNDHGFSEKFQESFQRVTGEILIDRRGSTGQPGMSDSIVQLRKSYRFGSSSGIGAVSRAVNEGDANLALSLMKDPAYPDIQWHGLPRPEALASVIRDRVISGFSGYLKKRDPIEIMDLFNDFRILCTVRDGPFGVHVLNLLVEQILRREGLIQQESRWYPERPVMVTKNDYNLRLFNGDVGITLVDPEGNKELRVFFPSQEGAIRKFPPLRLPEHETVYAMTVHKSQGSEFKQVLFILPDGLSPVLTRELIYTAITRAKQKVEVWGKEEIFHAAVSRRIARTSGLRDALWM